MNFCKLVQMKFVLGETVQVLFVDFSGRWYKFETLSLMRCKKVNSTKQNSCWKLLLILSALLLVHVTWFFPFFFCIAICKLFSTICKTCRYAKEGAERSYRLDVVGGRPLIWFTEKLFSTLFLRKAKSLREKLLQSYFRTHLWLEASIFSSTFQLRLCL